MTDPRYLSRVGQIRESLQTLGPPEDFIKAVTVHQGVIGEKVDLFVKGFCQTLLNEIHSGGPHSPGTPIDTGFARSNWHAGIGDAGARPVVESIIARSNETRGALGAEAQASFDQMDAVALSAKAGDVIESANNAHYIDDLEAGTSLQAPEGFVRIAVNAGQLVADEVAAHVMTR